ncbi:glycolate oxidase FAD binding subunit [Streptosporangium becharense]|uniref:Glycolate oxidase FAD binding subunit n=1 Tax=Streptosporangium becharense TaxID=1816182 RepID=A0A7W9IEQ2_9ACTN|nr:FAD-binding oxidoreductase [Streptosporangium becharense]MBB2912191.1 glycolate oxidase FAD binding subunit [Streptosporangium becharense]MBB5818738.1 glycolate oxidase FAD binding subunit [Streptosporangium becharense]
MGVTDATGTGGPPEAPEAMEALRATGAVIRDAAPGDAVAGVAPRWVASPRDTGEVAALMRVSAARDLAVVPAGDRTKLDWGNPPERCDLLLDTRGLTFGDGLVVEHSAGDLVARVSAGLALGTLNSMLAGSRQELALDGVPRAGTVGGTVGGTLATATAGPRRFRYGTARDLLIGVTVVLADGTVARSGGAVVKNVAGYDLGKLFTGSYGTLGVITEATFRLHPVPADRRWAGVDLPAPRTGGTPGGQAYRPGGLPPGSDGFGRLDSLVTALASAQAEPSAIEIDWPGPRHDLTVAVLVEGVSAGARAEALRELMSAYGTAWLRTEAPEWWAAAPGEDTLLELRVPPACTHHALRVIAAYGLPARVRGSAASAVLRMSFPAGMDREAFTGLVTGVRAGLHPFGGGLTVLAAPPGLADGVDRWGPSSAQPLMRRIKERFDPGRRMSPGRFVGGI